MKEFFHGQFEQLSSSAKQRLRGNTLPPCHPERSNGCAASLPHRVILSLATAARSEAVAESKDPLHLNSTAGASRNSHDPLQLQNMPKPRPWLWRDQ